MRRYGHYRIYCISYRVHFVSQNVHDVIIECDMWGRGSVLRIHSYLNFLDTHLLACSLLKRLSRLQSKRSTNKYFLLSLILYGKQFTKRFFFCIIHIFYIRLQTSCHICLKYRIQNNQFMRFLRLIKTKIFKQQKYLLNGLKIMRNS